MSFGSVQGPLELISGITSSEQARNDSQAETVQKIAGDVLGKQVIRNQEGVVVEVLFAALNLGISDR